MKIVKVSELPTLDVAFPVCWDDVAFVARGPWVPPSGTAEGFDGTVLVLGKTGLAFAIAVPFAASSASWAEYLARRDAPSGAAAEMSAMLLAFARDALPGLLASFAPLGPATPPSPFAGSYPCECEACVSRRAEGGA